MRILKLSLILRIDEELTEILKVKNKGQFIKKRNSKDHPLYRRIVESYYIREDIKKKLYKE